MNNTVGEAYSQYQTGEMAIFYGPEGRPPKKASGARHQYEMSVELYIDKPAVSLLI